MGLLGRVKSLTSVHKVGMVHLGNSSHSVHGTRAPSQPAPMKSGQRMANNVQAPHKPDSSPYGLHAAQLANAKTAVASSTPARYPAKKPINRAKRAAPGANFAGYRF